MMMTINKLRSMRYSSFFCLCGWEAVMVNKTSGDLKFSHFYYSVVMSIKDEDQSNIVFLIHKITNRFSVV